MNLAGINTDPSDVHEALESLEAVSDRLRRAGDPCATFPDIYSIITRNVAWEIRYDTGFFHEPAFISRLASQFARRYLETLAWALEGRSQDCSAWALAYTHSRIEGTLPLQHAALAISAHINFDLAQGIYQTIRELGSEKDLVRLERYKHDHDAVNTLLEASLPEAMRRLTEVYGCRATALISGRLRPWASRRMLSTLQRWRAIVWGDVMAMLASNGGEALDAILQRMERRSRRLGYQLSNIGSLNLLLRLIQPLEPLLGSSHRVRTKDYAYGTSP